MNPSDITERLILTSDGILTRATNIPFHARARKIAVSAHTAAGGVREVTINIGVTMKLVWRSDYPAMVLSADGHEWTGGMWMAIEMATYMQIPIIAGEHENRAVSASVAKTATAATVQQLRLLMNHWLRIRPAITLEVTELVHNAIEGKWSGAEAWRAIKAVPLPE